MRLLTLEQKEDAKLSHGRKLPVLGLQEPREEVGIIKLRRLEKILSRVETQTSEEETMSGWDRYL